MKNGRLQIKEFRSTAVYVNSCKVQELTTLIIPLPMVIVPVAIITNNHIVNGQSECYLVAISPYFIPITNWPFLLGDHNLIGEPSTSWSNQLPQAPGQLRAMAGLAIALQRQLLPEPILSKRGWCWMGKPPVRGTPISGNSHMGWQVINGWWGKGEV